MVRSFCLLLWYLSVFLVQSQGPRRAQWVSQEKRGASYIQGEHDTHPTQPSFVLFQMSGRWGIGYRISTEAKMWDTYDVSAFIDQLRTIKGDPGWIIVNLSGPAHGGDVYLSHHPLLWSLGNTDATPEPGGRDLFQELADAIHAEGLKVIAYMAAQGKWSSLSKCFPLND